MITGLERLQASPRVAKSWGRCGLLCNQASVTNKLEPAWYVCQKILGKNLTCLFAPQHGFEATVQDNMIESPHTLHKPTGLPIFSLYHASRQPTAEMVEHLDTFIIDMQIIGSRVYTFKYTIAAILRSAAMYNKKVVVLDRPNPLGGIHLEGQVLNLEVKSFVGEFEIPMRHALTAGEAALFFNTGIKADLTVLALLNWCPEQIWPDYKRPWVLTSPNMPTFETTIAFPGFVIFEGTNISEGRGTCLPFQLIGAPFITDAAKLTKRIHDLCPDTRGIHLRETQFMPTNQKWQGQVCNGFQVHVIDPHQAKCHQLALSTLRAFIELGGDKFQWKLPPYEYEYEKLPIQLIIGTKDADTMLKKPTFDLHEEFWQQGLETYRQKIKAFLLYERQMQIN